MADNQPLLVVSQEFNKALRAQFETVAKEKLSYTPDASNLVGSALQCAHLDGQITAYEAISRIITVQP